MEETKKRFTAILIFFIIGVLLGFGVSISYNKKSAEKNSLEENAKLMSQLEKAKKFFPSIPEMKSVFGTVKEINGNIVRVETGESLNPFEELPAIREVTVTQSTKIVKQEQKSPAEFQKEMEAFQKKMQQNLNGTAPNAVPVNPFMEKELLLSDIKVNDRISAESDKNIKTAAKFEATRIVVSSNNLPAPPTAITSAAAPPPPPAAPAQPSAAPPIPPTGSSAQSIPPPPPAAAPAQSSAAPPIPPAAPPAPH